MNSYEAINEVNKLESAFENRFEFNEERRGRKFFDYSAVKIEVDTDGAIEVFQFENKADAIGFLEISIGGSDIFENSFITEVWEARDEYVHEESEFWYSER